MGLFPQFACCYRSVPHLGQMFLNFAELVEFFNVAEFVRRDVRTIVGVLPYAR
jgi:hypothetical protein